MSANRSNENSWLQHNSGAIVIGLLVFLTQYVFSQMVTENDESAKNIQILVVEMTQIKGKLEPLMRAFETSSLDRYTASDAARDHKHQETIINEIKKAQQEQRKAVEELRLAINDIRAKMRPP